MTCRPPRSNGEQSRKVLVILGRTPCGVQHAERFFESGLSGLGVALVAAGKWQLWLEEPGSRTDRPTWAAPVLAPATVSVSIIVTGLIALRSPLRMYVSYCTALALRGFLIVLSCVWASPNMIAGGLPHCFARAAFAGKLAVHQDSVVPPAMRIPLST
jgi:hypothetical protein